MPVTSGRRGGIDRIFGRSQVFDERHAVGIGLDGPERIAEGILRHLAAGLTIGPARLDNLDRETGQPLFLG